MGKKVRKSLPAFFIIFILLMIGTDNLYANGLKVLLNGTEVNTKVIVEDNKVYLSLEDISQALGAKVQFDQAESLVSISTANNDQIVPEILSKVSPTVVGIIGTIKEGSDYSSKYIDNIAHGTGVIIKPEGEILTNAHVVKDMEKIVVVLADGSGYEATLKNIDEDTDLALVKIEKKGLSAAKLGKAEDIVIGQTVIAIGTPVSFSLRNSATLGIVSGVNRAIDCGYKLIQTDASINPGNSGGPLVNLQGEIIGLNSNKYAGAGIEGLGFSIPVDTINTVVTHFHKYGRVKRPAIGAQFEEDWAARVGLPTNKGLTVIKVDKNQMLKEGDVLVSINGCSVNTLVDLNEEMKKYLPGNAVNLKIKRNGSAQIINYTLGEKSK